MSGGRCMWSFCSTFPETHILTHTHTSLYRVSYLESVSSSVSVLVASLGRCVCLVGWMQGHLTHLSHEHMHVPCVHRNLLGRYTKLHTISSLLLGYDKAGPGKQVLLSKSSGCGVCPHTCTNTNSHSIGSDLLSSDVSVCFSQDLW